MINNITKKLVFISATLLSLPTYATSLYVSPTGQGDTCSEVEPCDFIGARNQVRTINNDMQEDIRVYVDAGLYSPDSAWLLIPEDSGSNGFNIHWLNKPDTSPVISSGTHIEGWTLHDQDKGIWQASVPQGTHFEHLWVDGRRGQRATSGENPLHFSSTLSGLVASEYGPNIDQWRNPQDIMVTKDFMWRQIHCPVVGINYKSILVEPSCIDTYKLPPQTRGIIGDIALWVLNDTSKPSSFAIENAYELLDQDGEWYLDKALSIVYYKPRAGEYLTEGNAQQGVSKVIYPALENLLVLGGSLENPIHNITIKGLTFAYSGGTKYGSTAGVPTEPSLVPILSSASAMKVNAGQSIRVEGNTFIHIGFDALHFDLTGKDLYIIGNGFGDISRSSLSVAQSNLTLCCETIPEIHPDNVDKFFDGVNVHNNYSRNSGIDNAVGSAFAFSGFIRNLNVSHNEIREAPTSGIRTSWRNTGWKGHTRNVQYSWNKIYDVTQNHNHGDFAGLYISGDDAGTSSMHHNFVDGTSNHNYAYYYDVFMHNNSLHKNVARNIPWDVWFGITGGWVSMAVSTGNHIHGNWTDSPFFRDMDIRFLWFVPMNYYYNNYLKLPWYFWFWNWTDESIYVMSNTGLEAQHQSIRHMIDIEARR